MDCSTSRKLLSFDFEVAGLKLPLSEKRDVGIAGNSCENNSRRSTSTEVIMPRVLLKMSFVSKTVIAQL